MMYVEKVKDALFVILIFLSQIHCLAVITKTLK